MLPRNRLKTCPRCRSTYYGESQVCSACRGRELSSSEVFAINAGRTADDSDPDREHSEPGRTVDLGQRGRRNQSSPNVTGDSFSSDTPMPVVAGTSPTIPLHDDENTEPEDAADPWVGKTLLGQFRITRKIGEGGFGATYLAEQAQLTRATKAVVKFIREDLPAQHREVVRKRFLREVVTLEKLDNHHLPKLIASGQLEDQLFMVMQYGGDTTLTSLLKKEGLLPPDRALRIGVQVCEALGEAHRWSVVHRDVKPDNILLSNQNGEDWVKLIDVGIAKILEDSEIDDPNSKLSAARLIIGTPQYMSPEQAAGSPVDGRSDLYSLACVLFQLMTGRMPVKGKSSRELLAAHVSAPAVTLKQAGSTLPAFFQPLFDKGLHKDPAKRFQTAKEMIAALDAARVRWEQANRPKIRKGYYIAAGGLALVIAAVAYVRSETPHITTHEIGEQKPAASGPQAAHAATSLSAPDGFVSFTGGTLQMGREAESGADAAPDTPVHAVSVGSFALAKLQTSVAEYGEFVRATGATRPAAPADAETRFGKLPVVNVPRGDATRYCAWKYPNGGRLPREEEWEWAARGSAARLYPWGSDYRAGCVNAERGEAGHLMGVDSSECATPQGIQGMVGNAWEWTASNSAAYPGSEFKAPRGLAVIRGGSFFQEKPEELTGSWRWFAPPAGNRFIGFRCAWSASAPE